MPLREMRGMEASNHPVIHDRPLELLFISTYKQKPSSQQWLLISVSLSAFLKNLEHIYVVRILCIWCCVLLRVIASFSLLSLSVIFICITYVVLFASYLSSDMNCAFCFVCIWCPVLSLFLQLSMFYFCVAVSVIPLSMLIIFFHRFIITSINDGRELCRRLQKDNRIAQLR